MEQILSDHDRNKLDQLIAEAEKLTKAQIVLAVINRSDNCAELPWKATDSAEWQGPLISPVYKPNRKDTLGQRERSCRTHALGNHPVYLCCHAKRKTEKVP